MAVSALQLIYSEMLLRYYYLSDGILQQYFANGVQRAWLTFYD